MDRRNFCKIALLAAGSIGFGKVGATAPALGRVLPRKARVTVVRRVCFEDFQSLYLADPECGPCRAFSTGETFEISGGCPSGFCPKAWEAISSSLNTASHCPVNPGENNVILTACPDGTRPVIFRIEL